MSDKPASEQYTAMKWVEDFTSVSKEQLVRGHTPDGIEARCLNIAQSYVGGSWNNAISSTDDVTVERISGGFTNQLYRVQLKDSVSRAKNAIYPNEPTEVAIKLYQAKHITNYNKDDPERLNDTIILNVMSQTGLGPTVYGIFEDGFIQAYHAHEQFRAKHQEDPQLVREVMKLLASINLLQVPIRKEANLILKFIGDLLTNAYQNFAIKELAEELDLKLLKSADVLGEFEELVEKIDQLEAPLVFNHNDFRTNNTLVVTDSSGNSKRVLSVDLEHAAYGTRGYDLGCIFWEWGQKNFLDMTATPPSDETLQMLVKLYIEEAEKLEPGYAAKEKNSFKQHLKEARLMSLFSKFFLIVFLIGQKEKLVTSLPLDRKKNLAFAEALYADYLQTKKTFIQKGFY